MDTVLALFKVDLGIMQDKRDEYFKAMISASKAVLEGKGFTLNLENAEDQILLSDYAAWCYRKRQEDVPLSHNLQWRIRNRIIRVRAEENNVH